MSYTASEQEHINTILDITHQLEATRDMRISALEEIPGDTATIFFTMNVPSVCGDGKRRYHVAEYLDYLFSNPTLDVMLANASATCEKCTYSYTLSANGIFAFKTTLKPATTQ